MPTSYPNLARPTVKFEPDLSSWVNPESYWVPSRLVLSAWLQHGPFASWLVSVLKPGTIAELGTHNGYSFFTFCEVVRRLRLQTVCYAVDTWEGDDHAGFYDDEIFNDVDAMRATTYPDIAVLLRGYFADHVSSFSDGSIDLLHIDGRHGYDDVKEDFESWLPKVSARGIVLFHDIAEHQEGFGVWKFWDELAAQYPSFAFEHGHGLGVLAVGTEIPEGLSALFRASKAETELIRAFYSQRGEFVEGIFRAESEYEELRAQYERLSALYARMVVSYSWRLTRPLRAVVRVVPRPVRSSVRRAARRLRGGPRG